MKGFNKLNTGLLVALTATVATVAQPQPASAQLLEVAAGALNALVRSRQPQPQVIQQRVPVPVPTPTGPRYDVGTNNANGNSLNVCLSSCLPTGSAPAPIPARVPQQIPQQMPQVVRQAPVMPQQMPQAPVVQQQTSGSVVRQSSGGTNTATTQINQQSSSQSAVVQNVPNPAAVNVPAANLPANMPNVPNMPR